MSRPIGSKNKRKVLDPAVLPENAVVLKEAVKTVVAKHKQSVKEMREVLTPPVEKKMIEGWVNVYKHVGDYCTNFFCGSDIHATKESASNGAQKGSLGQVFISVEDK